MSPDDGINRETAAADSAPRSHFIREIILEDRRNSKNDGRVHTRFPPEPNGYLHIGHAKSICLNFGLAQEFGGKCNLRFDDTNPTKEDTEFTDAIIDDVRWLGFEWADRPLYASDYFEHLYSWAVELIKQSNAFVCDLSSEEMRDYRGTATEPGRKSPWRDRPVDENLDLFERMRAGEFADGSRTLRAKIDMASPNFNMRDPVMYRILHAHHHRTADAWCIYPMYDFAHGQSDSIEGVTHSICTLEFEDHRPLYDWFLDKLGVFHPRQYEFDRLNLSHTILSKRKLLTLVENGHVAGWDDPRMPTLSGLRRRGYTPETIRAFCDEAGVSKTPVEMEFALLEHLLRKDLNQRAQRVMAVVDPVKLIIDNYPADQTDELDAINNPENPSDGTRKVPFSKVLYIERADFLEEAPKKYFRLTPGREVRLRYAYLVTCTGCVKNDAGEVIEVHCTHDPATRGGTTPDGRKVKSTIHWVSAEHALDCQARLYDNLLLDDQAVGEEDREFIDLLNPNSLEVREVKIEPSVRDAKPGTKYQFERVGYFCVDNDSIPEKPVFNRTVGLRDSWAKIAKKARGSPATPEVPLTGVLP